jgi:hypothetical protein
MYIRVYYESVEGVCVCVFFVCAFGSKFYTMVDHGNPIKGVRAMKQCEYRRISCFGIVAVMSS